MDGSDGTRTDGQGRFSSVQFDVDGKWFEACPMPSRAGHTVVARLQVNRIQLMSYDSTAVFISYGPGSTGMIEMAMCEQEVFDLDSGPQTLRDVSFQLRMISTRPCIDEGCLVAQPHEIDCGVRGISQPSSTHLPKIILDSRYHVYSLFSSVPGEGAIPVLPGHEKVRSIQEVNGDLDLTVVPSCWTSSLTLSLKPTYVQPCP